MFTTTHLIKMHHNGRFIFAGSVPVALGFARKDGAPLTEQDVRCIQHGVPGLPGLKIRSYVTKEEALSAAKECGVEVVEEGES